ncbi:haloacid dehalogenase type II [Palleronia sp. LCG004]|uniref:haloacid dehalogenase type II n=1 Tax=Palleronia sp. LCG004 TaxID=3079304 RepID=UPI002943D1C0|nr:haloacid dehalogenase type II [Palleronia sp. LCG004]WOI58358.1 haloacid dehalogenase type II [Palleronia sp. LCG004]
MTDDQTPSILVFDVNETLLDIRTLEPLFERLFGDRRILREWFAQLVVYSQSMTLSGLHTPFGELGLGALRMTGEIHGVEIAEADLDEMKDRMGSMPAHEDAAPALSRLREAGYRLVTLTNSPPSPAPTPLERAGLANFFERSFSVEAVGRFKPAPETYAHVARELDVEMSDLCLVACHLWDTLGAQAAGCAGAFVTRPGNAFLPAPNLPEPDIVAADMQDLAGQILGRWPAPGAALGA